MLSGIWKTACASPCPSPLSYMPRFALCPISPPLSPAYPPTHLPLQIFSFEHRPYCSNCTSNADILGLLLVSPEGERGGGGGQNLVCAQILTHKGTKAMVH